MRKFILRQLVLAGALIPQIALSDTPAPESITYGAFADSYWAFDSNDFGKIRPYTTQAVHDDNPRLNLGFVEAKLATDDTRGRLALQYGDSVISNYSGEADRFWRYIQEANFGYKISDNFWIDGGIYLSHIGFESFNSKDNWNYTRSFAAEYSPYYETGLKATYQASDTVTAQLHILKGWQNISQRRDPALGIQLQYTPEKSTQFTYANFVGNEHGLRIFNDFIAKHDLTDSFSLAAQFDVGHQERNYEQGGAWWHGWSIMSQYKLTPKIAFGSRVERYSDPHQIVLSSLSDTHFSAVGLSANVDVELHPGLLWRTEYRILLGESRVFPDDANFRSNDSLAVTSLSYYFSS